MTPIIFQAITEVFQCRTTPASAAQSLIAEAMKSGSPSSSQLARANDRARKTYDKQTPQQKIDFDNKEKKAKTAQQAADNKLEKPTYQRRDSLERRKADKEWWAGVKKMPNRLAAKAMQDRMDNPPEETDTTARLRKVRDQNFGHKTTQR